MMALPFVFILFIIDFPAGLVLYWMTTNLWTVGQGLVTRRLVPEGRAAADRSSRTSEASPGGGTGAEETAEAGRARRPRRDGRRRGAAAAPPPGEAEEESAPQMSARGRAVGRGERRDGRRGEVAGAAGARAAAPGIDKSRVRFQVVSEGERGCSASATRPRA